MKLFEIFGTVSVDSRGAMTELSKVDKQANKTGDAFGITGKKIQDAGKIAGQVGSTLTKRVTLPLTAAAGIAVKVGSTFQQSMANVRAVSGATGDEIEELTELARELGKESIFSASEAADALSYMGMAGWKTEQMIAGLPGVINLAAASGEDLALVSDIVTDSISAFGDEAEDASRYADVLSAAASASNTTVGALGEAFKKAAPYAGALGFSMEDTSKYLGIMADSGTKASVAGTTLRATFANLASPTDAVKGAMNELGVEIQKSDGSMKSLDDIMSELRVSFADLDEAQKVHYANLIAGRGGGAGFVSIMNATEEAVNNFGDAIDNSNGKAEEMSDIMKDTLQGRFKEMTSQFEEVGHIIYEIIEPALKLTLEILILVAKGFQAMPKPIQTVIVMLGALVAIVGPLLMLFSSVVGIFSKLSISGGVVTTVLGGLSTALGVLKAGFALLTGPVGLAVAAIAAIAGAGYLVIKNWDTIKERFSAVWGFITDGFKGFGETIGGTMSSARDRASEAVGNMTDNLKENLSELSERADEFKERFSETWEDVKVGTSEKMSEIGESIKGMGTSVSESWNDLKSSTSERLSEVGSSVGEFVGGITGSWQDLKTRTSETYNDIKDAMLKPIRTARDTVSNLVEEIKDFFKFEIKFPEINMPKVRGEGGLIDRATPNFMKRKKPKRKRRFFARGGYMSNPTEFARDNRTSYIGGEAGGEGIVPLDGKHMQPMAAEIAKILSDEQNRSKGDTNFNIESLIGHATVREEADVRRIAEELNVLMDRRNRQRGAYS